MESSLTEFCNFDHNQVTLTDKGTFHGMNVISTSTFQMIKDVPVQRITDRRKASDVVKKGKIPWKKRDGLLELTMQPKEQLTLEHFANP